MYIDLNPNLVKMAANGHENSNGEFSFSASAARDALPRITTEKGGKSPTSADVCHDDTAPRVNFQTIDELHSRQIKRSAPTTPRKEGGGGVMGTSTPTTPVSGETMLQSVRCVHLVNITCKDRSQNICMLSITKKKKKQYNLMGSFELNNEVDNYYMN